MYDVIIIVTIYIGIGMPYFVAMTTIYNNFASWIDLRTLCSTHYIILSMNGGILLNWF